MMTTGNRSRRKTMLKRYYDAKEKGMCIKCTIRKKAKVGVKCKICKDKRK